MNTQFMKITTTVVALLISSTSVLLAQGRPDTRYLTCATVKSIIQTNGAVVMNTSNYVYEKYVKNHAYCNVNESTKNAYVPTADYRRCKIGFICYDPARFKD